MPKKSQGLALSINELDGCGVWGEEVSHRASLYWRKWGSGILKRKKARIEWERWLRKISSNLSIHEKTRIPDGWAQGSFQIIHVWNSEKLMNSQSLNSIPVRNVGVFLCLLFTHLWFVCFESVIKALVFKAAIKKAFLITTRLQSHEQREADQ